MRSELLPLRQAKQAMWWRVVARTRERWQEVDGDQRVAAFAHFLLLSFVPLVVIFVSADSR